jgi:vacuolar protein sorting-associated protein 13A/C
VSIDVLAEGFSQVVRITNYDESLSLFKLQRRETSMSMSRSSSQTDNPDLDFEVKDQKSPITLSLNLSLEGIGISLVNKSMVELLYATFRGIRLEYNDSATNQSAHFVIKWIQIDNQLFGAMYKILLYPSVIPKDAKELEVRPNLDIVVNLLKDQGRFAHGYQTDRTIILMVGINRTWSHVLPVCKSAIAENDGGGGRRLPLLTVRLL